MKKYSKLGKRLMALALAVILVVGLMPTNAVAEGSQPEQANPSENQTFTLSLYRTTNEPTQSDLPESPDAAEERVSYQYSATVKVAGVEVPISEVKAEWGNGNYTDNGDGTVTSEYKAMKLTVTYKGRTLTVQYDENSSNIVEWSAQSTWANGSVKLGTSYDVTEPTVDTPSGLADGAQWEETANNLVDDKYTATDAATVGQSLTVATYELKYEDEVLWTISYTATVDYADVSNVKFTIGEEEVSGTKWYTSEQTLKISADSNAGDAAYLKPVEGGNWVKGSVDGSYTNTVTITETKEVRVGDGSVTVGIDTGNVSVSSVNAYRSGSNVIVEVNYSVGDSGVQKIKINGTEYTTGFSDTFFTQTLQDVTDGSVSVEVYSKSGKSASDSATIIDDLKVNIDVVNPCATVDGTVYYGADTELVFTVTGAGTGDFAPTVTVEGIDGVSLSEENRWTASVKIPGEIAANTIKIIAQDRARSATAIYDKKLAQDTEKPTIDLNELPQTGTTTYKNSSITYNINITDNVGVKSWEIIYEIKGKTPVTMTDSTSITLNNGDVLTRVEVTATDVCGLSADQEWTGNVSVDAEAPTISLSLDPDVISSLTTIDGKNFAILDSRIKSDESVNIVVTASIKEVNLDEAVTLPSGEGWSEWMVQNGVYTATYTVSISPDETQQMTFVVPVIKDKGGLTSGEEAVLSVQMMDSKVNEVIQAPAVNGEYTFNINVDRRYPSSIETATPVIEVTPEYDGNGAFKDKIYFTFHVDDISAGGADSGMKAVKWYVDDGIEDSNFADNGSSTEMNSLELSDNGEYTISYSVNGYNETNSATLYISVEDNAGNRHTYSYASFSVDNLAPRISLGFNNNEVASNKIFNQPRTATIKFEDLNLAENENKVVTEVQGTKSQIENGVQTYTIEYKDNGEYKLTVRATDANGNMQESINYENGTVAWNDFEIFLNQPEVTIEKKTEDGDVVSMPEGDNIEYHQKAVTYCVTILNDHFKAEKDSNAVLNYTIDDTTYESVLYSNKLVENQSTTNQAGVSFIQNDGYWVADFKLDEGQTLTDISVWAMNDAGSYATAVSGDAGSFEFADNKLTYAGKDVMVDGTAPEVIVVKSVAENARYIQSDDNNDYYNGKVTYTFTATDQPSGVNMDETYVTYTLIDSKGVSTESKSNFDKKITIEIPANSTLQEMSVVAKDNAGNITKEIKISDDDEMTSFSHSKENGVCTYKGHRVVVDTIAPKVTAKISNVNYFYTNESGVFAVLATDSLKNNKTESEDITVELTVTVEDANLYENGFASGEGCEINWEQIDQFTDENGDILCRRIGTITKTIDAHATAELIYNFAIKDCADNYADNDVTLNIETEKKNGFGNSTSLIQNQNREGYKGSILLDHRTPSSSSTDVPEIIIKPADDKCYEINENGNYIYNKNFSFVVSVSDNSVNGFDSGLNLDSVSFALDESDGVTLDYDKLRVEFNENAKEYTYTVPVVIEDSYESDACVLTMSLSDNVGNNFEFTMNFWVDTKAPEIEVEQVIVNDENNTGKLVQTVDGVDYYNNVVTYTITVSDLHLYDYNDAVAEVYYTMLNGVKKTVDLFDVSCTVKDGVEKYTYTVTVDNETILTDLSMSVTDVAGNETAAITLNNHNGINQVAVDNVTGNDIAADYNPPVVTVTQNSKDTEVKTYDGVDYYSENVTYSIQVSDWRLTNSNHAGQEHKATLTYAFEDGTSNTVELGSNTAWKTKDGSNSYEYEFTVENGKVLTKMSVAVFDNAGNPVKAVSNESNVSGTIEKGVWIYNGNKVAVDTTDPVITLQKTVKNGSYIQNVGDYDYYDGDVTLEIRADDAFLNDTNASKAVVTVTYQDGSVKTINLLDTRINATGSKLADADSYANSFTITDGQMVEDIQVTVVDNAGNVARSVSESDERVSFTYDSATNANKMSTNALVVDLTGPKAVLTVTGNVQSFYTNNGVAYVQLKNPGNASSGSYTSQTSETVTLVVTVSDRNLTLDKSNSYSVKTNLSGDSTAWAGSPAVNSDSTVTYTKSITVAGDSTGVFEIDMTLFDLAGHAITAEDISVTPINGTVPSNFKSLVNPVIKDGKNTGVVAAAISVDRRRPSSASDDNQAPVITVTPSISYTTSNAGNDLFSGAFSFAMTVTDGSASTSNSGIQTVDWTIADPVGFVVASSKTNPQTDGTYTTSFSIPVTVNGIGETNQAKLTVTAVDNVGNTTTYVKEFAVDNLAPRVRISYNNNSVLNGKYFKADRVATISVEDINFNADTTKITTQVGASGWSRSGDTYTAVCSYTSDGEYTFDMNCVDKANNTSTIDFSNGGSNAASQDFVVDKTAPVISVSYTPSSNSGKDSSGVNYYDQNLGVTVTIQEVNFNASEVQANMGVRNTLSTFRTSGNTHIASTSYTEGNDYSFTVAYTDLAGNPATAYSSETFSIDTNAPTIEISKGDMTADELNIVQDDLELGFTINDGESNLKNFTVEVGKLDSSFKTTVVDGSDYFTISGQGDRTTGTIDFTNIAKTRDNDGIYTVKITAEDYAGHMVNLTPDLVFSLNRFGSTFTTDDSFTSGFLAVSDDGVVYQSAVSQKLVIKEINPNRVWQDSTKKVEGSTITIAVNGNSIRLEKDADYTVTVEEKGSGSAKWYVYTYEIDPANFLENEELVDGKYSILLYGEDEAGNKNTNESNTDGTVQTDQNGQYTGKITFTLDHMAPVISVMGVESGEGYDAANQIMEINISDSSPTSIQVFLNAAEVELTELAEGKTIENLPADQIWLVLDSETGNYFLNITEENFRQNVSVIAVDAAGNTSDTKEITRIMVNSSTIVRLFNNTVFVVTLILLVVAIIVILILVNKKKGKKAKTEQKA